MIKTIIEVVVISLYIVTVINSLENLYKHFYIPMKEDHIKFKMFLIMGIAGSMIPILNVWMWRIDKDYQEEKDEEYKIQREMAIEKLTESYEEVIAGLEDLVEDRESFIPQEDEFEMYGQFRKDKEILERAILIIEDKKREINEGE